VNIENYPRRPNNGKAQSPRGITKAKVFVYTSKEMLFAPPVEVDVGEVLALGAAAPLAALELEGVALDPAPPLAEALALAGDAPAGPPAPVGDAPPGAGDAPPGAGDAPPGAGDAPAGAGDAPAGAPPGAGDAPAGLPPGAGDAPGGAPPGAPPGAGDAPGGAPPGAGDAPGGAPPGVGDAPGGAPPEVSVGAPAPLSVGDCPREEVARSKVIKMAM